uniref:Uncharacterized protein n=1 Tax=Panagrellus redivivus TaxID=6233 RepID=A0A7E4W4Z2_PANRE
MLMEKRRTENYVQLFSQVREAITDRFPEHADRPRRFHTDCELAAINASVSRNSNEFKQFLAALKGAVFLPMDYFEQIVQHMRDFPPNLPDRLINAYRRFINYFFDFWYEKRQWLLKYGVTGPRTTNVAEGFNSATLRSLVTSITSQEIPFATKRQSLQIPTMQLDVPRLLAYCRHQSKNAAPSNDENYVDADENWYDPVQHQQQLFVALPALQPINGFIHGNQVFIIQNQQPLPGVPPNQQQIPGPMLAQQQPQIVVIQAPLQPQGHAGMQNLQQQVNLGGQLPQPHGQPVVVPFNEEVEEDDDIIFIPQ